jgi:hypothetical protein
MGAENLKSKQKHNKKTQNAAKRKFFLKNNGAKFIDEKPYIPPDIHRLNYSGEFEIPYKQVKYITVREYVGNPEFKPLQQIPPEQLRSELGGVLEYLTSHNISVDFLTDISDEEAYDFITGELMEEETENIHIPELTTCFIYEEFHPNDKLDAEMFAELFLRDLFEQDEECAINSFDKGEIIDRQGNKTSFDKNGEDIHSFLSSYTTFTSYKFESLKCTIEGDYATVIFQGKWSGLKIGSGFTGIEYVSHKGESELKLKKSPFGGYDIVQAKIIGWE